MPDDMFVRRALPVRVKDGDSYILEVDLGYRAYVKVPVRVRGLYALELRQPGGVEAKAKAERIFAQAVAEKRPIIVQSYKDQMSFERWLCDLYIGGESMTDLMVRPE